MSQQKNLFSTLTKLFKSGPLVKRQIKGFDTSNIKSSALDVFRKSTATIYGNAINAYGSFDRLSRYSDFSEMLYEPIIARAIDIYADEALAQDDEGYSLHIHSENNKIKKILEELFYDTLNFEFVGRSWAKNLVTYGDFFLFNDVSPKFGIIHAHPIPVNELEREEGYDPNNPFAVRFRWITEGNQVLENWQISHFRLLGNDAFLPYGSSMIESARRIHRQYVMAKDAMLTYRVIRAPERRVFYIDVGNSPPSEVGDIIEHARATLKSQEVLDKSAGRVDLRYNPYSGDVDYFIPVRGDQVTTRIDTLPGGQNTTAIDDIELIRDDLFAALGIPKPYLTFSEGGGSKSNLAQEDVRFSRTTQSIQKVIISELNKMAAIHLVANNFTGEDIVNFNLRLSNPSTMAQQQKLEIIRTMFEIAGTRPEGLLSERFIYKKIFKLTDDEIDQMEEEQIKEMLRKTQMEHMGSITAESGGSLSGIGGGLGGGGGSTPSFEEVEEDSDAEQDDDSSAEDVETGEEDLFAGEEKSGPLLTDVEDEIIEFDLGESDEYTPVHQQNQLSRYKHNNLRPSRRKQKGKSGLNHPNLNKTISHKDWNMRDIYGKRAFSSTKKVNKDGSFKFMDSLEREVGDLFLGEKKITRLSSEVKESIESMISKLNINRESETLQVKAANKGSDKLIIESDEGKEE